MNNICKKEKSKDNISPCVCCGAIHVFVVSPKSSQCSPRSWILLKTLQVLLHSHFDTYLVSISSTSALPEGDDSLFRSWFSICHLVGMLSALVNPVLYGYYNQVYALYGYYNPFNILYILYILTLLIY